MAILWTTLPAVANLNQGIESEQIFAQLKQVQPRFHAC